MKLVLFIGAVLAVLAIVAVYDMGEASKARALAKAQCRAPERDGDITLITIDVRAGTLYFDCQYATTRPSKPKIKGG